MALLTIILLFTGGRSALTAIQTASVICGLPNAVLLVFMCIGFIKSMLHCKEYDKVGTFDKAN
jgi:choline-glycine betaine transporter